MFSPKIILIQFFLELWSDLDEYPGESEMVASRLSDSQVVKLIRESLGGMGRLIVTVHARKAMADDGYDMADLKSVLGRGRLTNRETDVRGEERYTIEGPTTNSTRTRMAAVCKLLDVELETDPDNKREGEPEDVPTTRTLVITVFDEATRWSRH